MTSDQIANVLQSLADKFGVTVEYLWPRLVTYTFWSNAINVLVEIGFIVIAVILTPKFFARIQVKRDRWLDSEVTVAVVFGIATLAAVIAGFVAACSLPNNVAGTMSPEGKALLDLLAAFGGKKS